MNMENELLNKLCLNSEAKIESAINKLNESGLKIVLILNSDQKIVGTVSDGDIRRGLLKDSNLQNEVKDIMNHYPITVNLSFDREAALLLMDSKKIDLIPIVDDEKRLIGLHHKEDVIKVPKRSNIVFIMAGGKGSRLHPHTENCPKPMLKIGGKPILERVIRRAANQGFYKFIISIHHLGEIIEHYFGDGSGFGVEIEYLREEVPLGTAGSLKLIKSIPSCPIVVTNGDLLTDINYSEMIAFHETNKSKATMAVRLHEYQNQFGVVKTRGIDIVEFIEKPVQRSFINAGVYVIEPGVISFIKKGVHLDMPELFELVRSINQRVVAYPMYEAWQDIGNPNDFANAILEMESADIENDK